MIPSGDALLLPRCKGRCGIYSSWSARGATKAASGVVKGQARLGFRQLGDGAVEIGLGAVVLGLRNRLLLDQLRVALEEAEAV